MLKSLQIKDYALIENIYVEFGERLNIITGETGAGKSIIIDALGLILGERASTEVIRKGAEKSIVEGIFGIKPNSKVLKILSSNNIEVNSELIVRREITHKGSNRCFLNDTPAPLQIIREVGKYLVDLHGQHEHQSLLRTETHIDMLDDLVVPKELLEKYSSFLKMLNRSLSDLSELRKRESLMKEKKELYDFQAKEIDSIDPQPEEDAKLMSELNILENSEKLLDLSNSAYSKLFDEENSVYDSLGSVRDLLIQLAKIDSTLAEQLSECDSALNILNETALNLRSYRDRVNLDPDRLEEVRQRLGALNILKKKYGGSVKDVLNYRTKIAAELDFAENFDDKITGLQKEVEIRRINAGKIAKEISILRKNNAEEVNEKIEEILRWLGINDGVFKIVIKNIKAQDGSTNFIVIDGEKYICNNKGYDEVEFFISTNLGEDVKPLVKVASGGEVSRIMLALKSVLAKNDKLPLMIFDEIDTGVSGRVAVKVGKALKSLAEFHQIISITHLPQIAALADFHYSVRKEKKGNRVTSSIVKLDSAERVTDIAKLLSGENVTEASIQSADELIKSIN